MTATIRMANDSDAAAIAAIYGPFVRDTAKLGAWRDVGWWARPCGDYPAVPDEPQPVSALRTAPDWQALLTKGVPMLRV